MAWIRVISGPQEGETYRLTEAPATIGRGPANIIQLRDASISRRHVSFQWVGKTHKIVDLHSENGVFVNGERVTGKMLHSGDRLVIGACELLYEDAPGLQYEDYSRHRKDATALTTKGETRSVQVSDIEAMLAEEDSAAAPAAIPVASPAAPAGTPQRPGTAGGVHRAAILSAVRQRVAAGGTLAEMLEVTSIAIVRTLDPDRVAIMLKGGRQAVLKPAKTYQRPTSSGGAQLPPLLREIVLATVRTRSAQLVGPGAVLPSGGNAPRQTLFGAMCTPIIARGTLQGALYVDNAMSAGKAFDAEDLRFIKEVAGLFALVASR